MLHQELMSSTSAVRLAPERNVEDPLAYLPCSSIRLYEKGKTIYDRSLPSGNVFLILTGKVKASRITEQGAQVILDIYKQDEFFGECAILDRADRSDVAVAYEKTQVMVWAASEIEELSRDRP